MQEFVTSKSDDKMDLLPSLFDDFLGCKDFHHVRRASKQDQHHRDQEVIEVFLEQIERFRRCHAGDKDVQPVHKHQAGTFQARRCCVDALDVRDRLVVVDDDLMGHRQFWHVRNDSFFAGLLGRCDWSPRV